jgi:small-conductance mechanosensitive channel
MMVANRIHPRVAIAMWDEAWHELAAASLLFLPKLVTGAVIMLVFWIVGRISERLILRTHQLQRRAPELTHLLGSGIKICLLSFGAVTALGTLGIQVTALVAGLGLTGFAVGFALKDIISNALSGVMTIFFRPFKHGDTISIFSNMPFEGQVIDINLRYTVLESPEKRIFVPNSILFTNVVSVRKAAEPKKEAS